MLERWSAERSEREKGEEREREKNSTSRPKHKKMGPQFLGLLGLARRARSSRAAGGLTLGLSRAGSAATLWPAQQQQQRHWIGAQWCRSVAGCAQAEPAPETYRINVVTGEMIGQTAATTPGGSWARAAPARHRGGGASGGAVESAARAAAPLRRRRCICCMLLSLASVASQQTPPPLHPVSPPPPPLLCTSSSSRPRPKTQHHTTRQHPRRRHLSPRLRAAVWRQRRL